MTCPEVLVQNKYTLQNKIAIFYTDLRYKVQLRNEINTINGSTALTLVKHQTNIFTLL